MPILSREQIIYSRTRKTNSTALSLVFHWRRVKSDRRSHLSLSQNAISSRKLQSQNSREKWLRIQNGAILSFPEWRLALSKRHLALSHFGSIKELLIKGYWRNHLGFVAILTLAGLFSERAALPLKGIWILCHFLYFSYF